MKKSDVVVLLLVIGWIIGYFIFTSGPSEDLSVIEEKSEIIDIDWDKYNYEFIEEDVKPILNKMIKDEKTAFYLPSTGYVNVSVGSGFGVAYAVRNTEPSNGDSFTIQWTVDDSIVDTCNVSAEKGQSWINRGTDSSWGRIRGEWIDHMVFYVVFPEDTPVCSVKYNLEIEKEGILYDTKTIEYNIA